MCLGALALSGQYQKDMTLICKSHGIGNNIFNPIYKGGDRITSDINPKCS